jgi:hypothetical protein
LSALANGSSTTVTLNFTAPAATGSVFVAPWIYNGTGDANDTNDHTPSVTTVLPGGVPVIDSFSTDPGDGTFTLGMETIPDVHYVFNSPSTLRTGMIC